MPARTLAIVMALLLSACSGGGGSSDNGSNGGANGSSSGGGGSTAGGSTAGGSSAGGNTEQPASLDRVSVAMSGSAAPVPGGGSAQFDVTVTNPGATATADVGATVVLGSGLTKSSVTCTARNGAVCPANPSDLQIPSLAPGGVLQFSVIALVAPGTSGQITSTVSVSAAGDSVTTDNSAQVVIDTYSADVRVTGDATALEFYSGALATYSMTLSNMGPDTARNVAIQDVVGAGQAFDSITCQAAGAAQCPATLAAEMSLPELPVGSTLTFMASASVGPSTVGPISNTLYVTSDGDPLKSNNVATVSATASIPTSPLSSTFVSLQSDGGDYIGQGETYDYTTANALITVNAVGGSLTVDVSGDEYWTGNFVLPSALSQLARGTYANLKRYPFNDAAVGGLSWSGEGRGCNTLTGSFTIDAVTYAAGSLATFDLRFEQHCEGGSAALRGQIHWVANDNQRPPGPVNPPPAGLWSPAPGATPATGNYLYLQSDGGDYIGAGRAYTYTQANAVLTVTANGGHLSVGVAGNEDWNGDFQTMSVLSKLMPGYYANLERYPFNNPATGGLSWYGEGRGCNTLVGWFVVDNITYVGLSITALDVRFEQHCEGGSAALRGKIHWTSGDTTQPPGPQTPPANLWAPAPGATPASGNYVYLDSQFGDYIGAGNRYTYTQANSLLQVTASGARLNVGINGDEYWTGDFQGMNTISALQPGYYGGLQRYPFNNPVAGGLSWSGEARGCNTLSGWFVIDGVTYSNGALAAIDLRFEQRCEGGSAALHGAVHWAVGDTTAPPGPQNPPPAGLWAPAPGSTPASGSYVYLASSPGDYIAGGNTYTYTEADAILRVTSSSRILSVSVTGDEDWGGQFAGMGSIQQLEPGYYGNLKRYPFNNPVTGGLSWSGEGRGCNKLTGWFVVDAINYVAGAIDSVDLRFEQHCDGGAALHGAIHWNASDTATVPGPVSPPPANLWAPPSGATPATGNFIYLVSDAGDYIGGGQTYSVTPPAYTVSLTTGTGRLIVGVNGSGHSWTGDFQAMSSLSQLQPGYYGGLQRDGFHNPLKGGIDWSGDGRGCNTIAGWFVVDSVTYSAGSLASIDLRFEQHCEGVPAALHGAIHWIR